jgi:hypothetical protein
MGLTHADDYGVDVTKQAIFSTCCVPPGDRCSVASAV